MATRKVKRYNGEDGSDVSSVDVNEPGMKEAEPAENFKPTSFKNAFAAAKDGSTFMWQGKSYKIEYASHSSKVAKEVKADIKAQESANAAEKSTPRVGRASQATAGSIRRAEPTAEGIAAANEKRAQQRASMGDVPFMRALRAIRERGESGPPAYKKGGSASSRADGIAMRGKTRGKLY